MTRMLRLCFRGAGFDTSEATTGGEALPSDEHDVVALAKQGNAAGLGEIYDRHVSIVYRYAYALLGNRSEAEDLTAETFPRALHAIERYRSTGRPVHSWLLIIARDLGMSRLRRKQRTKDAFRLLPAPTSSDPGEARSAYGVNIQELRRALATLSPSQREVIILRFVLDLDHARVAQVVGQSLNNVKVIQYRALRKLHEKLAPGGR